MFEFKKAEIGVVEEDRPEPSHLPFAIKKVSFDPKQPPISFADGEDLWIGVDAEWVTRDGQNIVLSYQDYCVNSRDETLGKVIYPEPGKRLAFETCYLGQGSVATPLAHIHPALLASPTPRHSPR